MSEQRVILAVDIGGSKYVAGLVKENGEIISKRRYVWKHISADSVVEEISCAMEGLMRENPEVEPSAVGVTIPGLADPLTGTWISACFMKIYNFPIARVLRERFHYRVFIENDCNASAVAERMYGLCKRTDSFIYLTVSNSIGGALFMNGSLFRGGYGKAGEFGLCPVDREVSARKRERGPLENYASGRGLVQTYIGLGGERLVNGEPVDGVEITKRARAGEAAACKAFEIEGRYLGHVIAMGCAVLDPEKVIIGGGLSLAFDQYRDHVIRAVKEEIPAIADRVPQIQATGLGYDGGLLGAAAVAVCELKNFGG